MQLDQFRHVPAFMGKSYSDERTKGPKFYSAF